MANGGGNTTQGQTSGTRQTLLGRFGVPGLAIGGAGLAALGAAVKTGHDMMTNILSDKVIKHMERRKQSLLKMRARPIVTKGAVAAQVGAHAQTAAKGLGGRGRQAMRGGGFNPSQPRDSHGQWD